MKIFNDKQEKSREIEHEEKFCNYSHQCFTRIYGPLLTNEKNTIGFIYEFMCNGSLKLYIKSKKVDETYLLMTIYRIFNGIEYLHKNGLIHLDLKPANILIDHDFLPYISDFETIRPINSPNGEYTNDIGSSQYSSPEQDKNINISYPTDIYSFGLIIYYLFEKVEMWLIYPDKKEKIKSMTKGPVIVHYLYEKCVQYKQEDRLKIEEINIILNSELFNKNIQVSIKQSNLKLKEYYEKSVKKDISDPFFYLGDLYAKGIEVKTRFQES